MRRIPQLPRNIQHKQGQVLKMLGLDCTDNFQVGSLREMTGFMTNRYPYYATRNKWNEVNLSKIPESGFTNTSSDYTYLNPIIVSGVEYDYRVESDFVWGDAIGDNFVYIFRTVSSRYTSVTYFKYWLVVGDNVVLIGDNISNAKVKAVRFNDDIYFYTLGKYYNGESGEIESTNLNCTCNALNQANKVSIVFDNNTGSRFAVGDSLVVTGNNKSVTVTFTSVTESGGNIIFTTGLPISSWNVSSLPAYDLSCSRCIPKFDFADYRDNRIWAVRKGDPNIYSSANGKATEFGEFDTGSLSSYYAPVASEYDWTGLISYGSATCCFKQNRVHKVLGSYPAEFQIYDYTLEGVQDGSDESLCEVNGALMYLSPKGVYSFTGSYANLVSEAFGDTRYQNGRSGYDGKFFYLSCERKNDSDDTHLFTLDTTNGLWTEDTDILANCNFCRYGTDFYAMNYSKEDQYDYSGKKYIGNVFKYDINTRETNLEWKLVFNPFIETISGTYNSKSSVFAKKRYSKLVMRYEMEQGTEASVYCKFDDNGWELAGKLNGLGHTLSSIAIRINRCDKFQLKIVGRGAFTLLNMTRYYITGSDR